MLPLVTNVDYHSAQANRFVTTFRFLQNLEDGVGDLPNFFALSYTNWQIIRHTTILPGKNMKASSKHLDKVP